MSATTSVAATLRGPVHASRERLQKAHDVFNACKYPPCLYGANLNSPILLALHAKESIVDDIQALRTAPNMGLRLGNPFTMQTPSRATANASPLQSSTPVSALDGNRPQLSQVNVDMQRSKPRQLSLSTAFGLSANPKTSKAQFSGSKASSPGAWESNSTLEDSMAVDSISANQIQSASSAALKVSTKKPMPNPSVPQVHRSRWESDSASEGSMALDIVPNLLAPQSRRSRPSAASKLRRSVLFAENLDDQNEGKNKITL